MGHEIYGFGREVLRDEFSGDGRIEGSVLLLDCSPHVAMAALG